MINYNNKNLTMNEFIHGVVGKSKSNLGIGLANKTIIETRLNICNKCPEMKIKINNINNKMKSYCNICGCDIKDKTRLKNENCELNKW